MLILESQMHKKVRIYSSPHFIIIQALVLHHTYIGLCKYCDIQKIVAKFAQRPPLLAFCNILLRFVCSIEAWPLCRSCKYSRYNFNCLQHTASGVYMNKQFLR